MLLAFGRVHQQSWCRRIHVPLLRPLVNGVPVHALVLMVDWRRQEYIRIPLHDADSHVRVARERMVQIA